MGKQDNKTARGVDAGRGNNAAWEGFGGSDATLATTPTCHYERVEDYWRGCQNRKDSRSAWTQQREASYSATSALNTKAALIDAEIEEAVVAAVRRWRHQSTSVSHVLGL